MPTTMLKNVAIREEIGVPENADVARIIETMNRNRRGVAVLLKEEKPLGIVTERQVLKFLGTGGDLGIPARELMVSPVISARENRRVAHAITMMIDHNIRRIVVVDEMGRFTGVVAQKDLTRHLEEDIFKAQMQVFHLISKGGEVLHVFPEDPIRKALDLMIHNGMGSVPVLEKGKPVGMITERDVLKVARAIDYARPVKEIMTSPVVTVSMETPVVEAITVMNSRGIRRLVVVDPEGKAVNVLTNRDILKNVQGNYQKFLETKVKHARDVLNHIPEVVIEVSNDGKEQVVSWSNQLARDIFGDNIIDADVTEIIPEEDWKQILFMLENTGCAERRRIFTRNRYFRLSGFCFKAHTEGVVQLIMKDITDDVTMSSTDHLTGLYNRRHVDEYLDHLLEKSKTRNLPFAVIMIDVDNFKSVNDTLGHSEGDRALKELAKVVKSVVGDKGLPGRFGGEEFIVALPEHGKQAAEQVAEAIRSGLHTIPLALEHYPHLTASIGVSGYPEDERKLELLLDIADLRLYAAKQAGKDRVEAWAEVLKK